MANNASQTSTETKNFLQKCCDYFSRRFTSVIQTSHRDGNLEENLSGNVSDKKQSDGRPDGSKLQIKIKQESSERDGDGSKKPGKDKNICKHVSYPSMFVSTEQTEATSFDNHKPSTKDDLYEREMENMNKQENERNEREKEIIHLQEKVLRLQEKICKLQQRVSILQGISS